MEVNQYIQSDWIPEGAILLSTFPTLKLAPKKGTKYYYEELQQNLNSQNPDPNLQDLYASAESMHPDWDSMSETFKGEMGSSMADIMKTQIERQLKDSADNVSRGLIPGELVSLIDELFKIKPQLFNWKAYFRRFLGNSYDIFTKKTYRKESLRFPDSAGLKIKKKHRILVGVDTSGSVSDQELAEFFSEIHHVWKADCSVDIIECDARIGRIYEYKGKFDGKCTGRGGTIFKPVIDYYNSNKDKYSTLVYFTDGYGENPIQKPHKNMMWVVTSNGYKERKYYPGYMIQIPPNTTK